MNLKMNGKLIFLVFLFSFSVAYFTTLQFKYIGGYLFEPYITSFEVIRSGRLSNLLLTHSSYESLIMVSNSYPVPLLIASSLTLVTGLPQDLSVFIPVIGFSSIIYFVILMRLLESKTNGKGNASTKLPIVLSCLSYVFFLTSITQSLGLERESLGFIFFLYFIYALLLYLERGSVKQSSLLIIILATTISMTHYTMALALILVMIVVFVISPVLVKASSFDKMLLKHRLFFITILLILTFTFLYNTYISYLAHSIESPLTVTFSGNFVLFVRTLLEHAANLELVLSSAQQSYVTYDATTAFLQNIQRIVRLYAIFTIVSILAFPKHWRRSMPNVWLLALVASSASVAEFAYLIVIQSLIGLRFLIYLGAMAIPFFTAHLYERINRILSPPLGSTIAKIVILSLVICLVLSYLGNFRIALTYGNSAAKWEGYYKVQPLASFTTSFASDDFTRFTGDVYYILSIVLNGLEHSKEYPAHFLPLGRNVVALYNVIWNKNSSSLLDISSRYKYIIINIDGSPIWGSVWGYTMPSTSLSNLKVFLDNSNIVYCDNNLVMFQTN